jgi:hypothetical protein
VAESIGTRAKMIGGLEGAEQSMPPADAFDSGRAEIERPFPSAKHYGCDLSPLFTTCNPLLAYRSTTVGMLLSMVNVARVYVTASHRAGWL